MTDKKFNVSMSAENIGPHYGAHKLTFSEKVDSNKIIFYAENGVGKSFISRAFRLCAPLKTNVNADDILTLDKEEGHFHFGIRANDIDKNLDISIKRGEVPIVSNKSMLLFHVFNSDYVEDNVKAKNYTPDGKIEGYILGKVQIDLTEERRNAATLQEEIDADSKVIDDIVEEAKSFLRDQGVMTNTTEYQKITREKIEHGFEYDTTDSVEQCVQKIKTLEGIPEDLPDINYDSKHAELSFLDELKSVLMTIYPKSDWDEEFVKEYKEHQTFIEAGLEFDLESKKCPFCKREYDLDALNLINRYKEYRNDREAQVVGQLRNLRQLVKQMTETLDSEGQKITSAMLQLSTIQKYFPSLASVKLKTIERMDEYKALFRSLYEMILKKIDNLCIAIDNVENTIGECRQVWSEIESIQKNNLSVADTANKTKNDANTERRLLRKNLCKAKSLCLQSELSDRFESIKKRQDRLKKVKEEIARKEQQTKISKREKVYETLGSSLNRFFHEKYQIDKDTFQIKFYGNNIGEKASKILSDGEKSIVAFCWYLAETHIIINSEDDYNKLFFVIDDPISSMDFNFVYAVAQAIRDIKGTFGITSHERIWIFTHNNEFFNIVTRNNIMANAFIMTPGKIMIFNNQLLMPYENHLSDLVEIVNKSKEPNHTTGNSIRHVIETISRFESPEIALVEYVRGNDILSKDSFIFTLCQDLSHGGVRMEIPYSEDVLREAAKKVIDFIKSKYPGQLKSIRQKVENKQNNQ